ncbi:glutamate--cysteine ligase [Escherichia coli]|nr:glutamate--cysteine ligase [Escherichia coli]
MQTISGVHYNFSLPMAFWQAKCGDISGADAKEKISAGYFRVIRNYYRFGWVIPYLFGGISGDLFFFPARKTNVAAV